MTIALSSQKPFAQGGNRLCFIDPADADRCIKVRRPDFTLEDCRRKKGFPKNLKPLSSFDDSLEEFHVMQGFERHYPDSIFDHVSRCFGFVDTDMGRGLSSELIRDSDGRISITLKQYVWERGYTPDCQAAVDVLCKHWLAHCVPSRDILVHNVVVQRDVSEAGENIRRLVVIDGLGSSNVIPLRWQPRALRQKKTQRKIDNFHQRIDTLIQTRSRDSFPGTHGLLFHDGLSQNEAVPSSTNMKDPDAS